MADPPSNLVLFANARAGGGAAKAIIRIFSEAIGDDHVFDLARHDPKDVLAGILLQGKLAAQSSPQSSAQSPVAAPRIIVAGGDGTVTWILGIIAELTAAHPTAPTPPVAILPLGTGNDLAINLGWGKTFHPAAIKSPAGLARTMTRIAGAPTTLVDLWKVRFDNMPFAAKDALPLALRLCTTGGSDEEGTPQPPAGRAASSATSTFWNYLSIGLDAQTAYSFHSLRERHPACTSSRLINQAWYGVFTCGTGWFCGGQALVGTPRTPPSDDTDDADDHAGHAGHADHAEAPRHRIIRRLRIKKHDQDDAYTDVDIPKDIRAIVLLNLQTYGGGRDIWGMHNEQNLERKGLQRPAKDDGLLEVIGFRNGWHTALVMGEVATQRVHGKRLGQGCAVEIFFDDSCDPRGGKQGRRRKHVCMQLDGEPWKQRLQRGTAGPGELEMAVGAGSGNARAIAAAADDERTGHGPRLTVSWGGRSHMLDGIKGGVV